MKVGDLVMWTGKDEWHGMIGMVAKVTRNRMRDYCLYEVQWSDGVYGIDLHESEIKAVTDEEVTSV